MKKLLAILLLLSSIPTIAFAHSPAPKVIVVGAGLAGLTTAYRLHSQGVDVEIYEARARVGGRVFTIKINGEAAELGGANITDGGAAKHLMNLIHELDLETVEKEVASNPAYFDGKECLFEYPLLKNKGYDPDRLKMQLRSLADHAHTMEDVLSGLLKEEDPLYKLFSVRLAGYEGGDPKHLSPLYTETLYHMLLGGICAAYPGAGAEEQSFTFASIRGGNGLLAEKMAQELGSRLHLNSPLTEVSKNSNGTLTLTFDEKTQVIADQVVFAMPCTTYKAITFGNDVIPSERLETIKNIRYGTNAKIILPLNNSLLDSSITTFCCNDRIGSFIGPCTDTLTLYYVKHYGYFSEKTLQATYEMEEPMLQAMFQHHLPVDLSPAYARDASFVDYRGPVGYSWPNDPYAQGSYAYIAAGQEQLLTQFEEVNGELVKTVFAPIDHKIYFAGEHTSILMDVPGTMEAACESGERTARMLIRTLVSCKEQ